MSEGFGVRTMKRKNVKGLALNKPAPRPPPPADDAFVHEDDQRGKGGQLEIGIEYKLDLKREDLEVLKELGSGNGGTVSKVRHIATGTVMARKVIHVEAKKETRRRIVRELHIMHECNSDYIVNFYGAFLSENNDVIMCMEYMDVGSLDRISRDFGPVRVDVLGKIAEATLAGLTYLYKTHHIMHRDIKPSNILVNSKGYIKLCDFGVSGELVNSVADTFVGTSTYMAPERIQGEKYTVKSDVWSFGLSIMELAIGKFPFDASEHLSDGEAAPAGILDLLQQIVHEPAPRLPKSEAFPAILEDMIQKCMCKKPEGRPTPQELYEREPFIQAAKRTPVDLQEWAVNLMEKNNRRSHLAPQLSPSTQDLLRGSDSPTTVGTIPSSQPTPTSTSGKLPLSNSSSNLASQQGSSVPLAQREGQIMTPREHVINAIQGNGNARIQSPRQEQEATMGMGNLSLGRSSGQAYANQASVQMQMPPMGQRMPSSRSQREVESPAERQERPSASREQSFTREQREPAYTHSIPMRPAPLSGAPSGALAPPPPVPGKDPLGLYEQRRQQWAPQQSQNGYAQPQQPQQAQHGYYGSSSGHGRENERQYSREDQNGRGYRDDRNGGY